MITYQQINELSTRYQTSELNISREYCQHLFLSYLYKRKEAERIFFKGGTALKIVFSSPRFSEDLDFSAYDLTASDIDLSVQGILDDIDKEGIQTEKEVNPGTQGATSGGYFAIINFKLLEFDSEIRIQISLRRNDELESNTALIENDFIPPYTIIYLGERLLVGEKIQALLDRAKTRDFFDLYFILRHRELVKYLPRDIDNLKHRLIDKINSNLVNGWENELRIFLPTGHHAIIKDFKPRLLQEIENHL